MQHSMWRVETKPYLALLISSADSSSSSSPFTSPPPPALLYYPMISPRRFGATRRFSVCFPSKTLAATFLDQYVARRTLLRTIHPKGTHQLPFHIWTSASSPITFFSALSLPALICASVLLYSLLLNQSEMMVTYRV